MRTPTTGKPLLFAVDDEPRNLELLVRALQTGYAVRTFTNALQALDAAREERPTVVITDFRMPQMNGIAFLRALKAADIPCVALLVTAYGDSEELRSEPGGALFVRIIHKPWKAEELRKQVDLAVSLFHMRAGREAGG